MSVALPVAPGPALRPPDSPARPPATGRAGWPLVLAVGLVGAVQVAPERLVALDLVWLVALPLLVVHVLERRRLVALAVVTLTWTVAQFGADALHGTGPRPSMPVIAAVGTLAGTVFLVRLAGDDPLLVRRLVAAVALGLAVSEIVFVHILSFAPAFAWKFELVTPVTVGLLALADLAWAAGRRLPTYLTLAGVVAADFFSDARSAAALALLTLVLYLLPRHRGARLRASTAAGIALGLFVAVGLAFFPAAKAGLLGQRSQEQVHMQRGSDPVTLLVGARPELLQAAYLAAKSPLTGYGSRPALDSETFLGSVAFVQSAGVVVDVNLRHDWLSRQDRGVASHSMALDTVVRAGIFALPFWLFLWVLGIRRAQAAFGLRTSPLVVFWTGTVLWDSLFSPLGGTYHVLLAGYLALLMTRLPVPPGGRPAVPA